MDTTPGGLQPASLPSLADLLALPVAAAGRYELYDDEIQTLRGRIYSLNSENAFGWRWRTSKLPIDFTPRKARKGYADTSRYLLIVWRVR